MKDKMSRKVVKELKIEGISADTLEAIYDHWNRFNGAYFWSPPGSASGRRSEEKRHYRNVDFSVNGEPVNVEIQVTCSCKNYYVSRDVTVDGTRKARGGQFLKKLLEKGTF